MAPPEEDTSPLTEEREDLLREAERTLKGAPGREAAGEEGPPRAFLLFGLGNQWYGVDLSHVRKILRPSRIARVPGAAPEILGLMNCQGEVLAVLDLREALGVKDEARGAGAKERLVVVLSFGSKEAGILVDAVEDIWEIPASGLLPVLESLEPSRARFFEGTAARDGRFVGLLSVSMCLNP